MSTLKCGAAERDVTPPLGLNIPQCMSLNPATGIKDGLYTHAIAIESNGKAVILISVDTSGLGTAFTKRVRKAISERIAVEESAIMVSAIHIHTGGPQLMEVFWGQKEDKKVTSLFFEKTVEAALEAYENRVDVTVRFAKGREDRISFCRNYVMKDGSIETNPGRRAAADIVSPAAEIDHTLSMLHFDDISGRTVAQIVNFACHPDTVGGNEYCADYPGELRRALKEKYGKDHVVAFLNGFSGNVNHIDAQRFTDPDFRYPKDHYKIMGRILAEDVLTLHNRASVRMESCVVDHAAKRFRAPRRQPEPQRTNWASETLVCGTASGVSKSLAREILKLSEHPKKYETVEIQVLRISDVYIVGFPGEPFSDIGLDLRKKCGENELILSELANNELGYFATEPAFSAGVYEAVLPSDPFETDVIEKMINTAAELVKKLSK